jgi:hypothetical protein
MTISLKTVKGIHQKRWEPLVPAPIAQAAGGHIAGGDGAKFFAITATGGGYLYDACEGSWLQLPTTSLGGTFGIGATSRWNPQGPSGTASGGSTTTINTSLTLVRDLRGKKIRITAGPNAGAQLVIASNTTGANSIITVPTQGVAFDGTTTFVVMSGRMWCVVGGTPGFGYYDWATNAWTSRAVAGLTAGTASTGNLIGCSSDETGVLISGTATAGGASTLTDSGKAWTTNALALAFQIRITAGTGAGQIRTIASNTGTAITVSAAWTTQPDATSAYAIEGNDDTFYFIGNNAVTMYRYSIAANTWSTISPAVARAAAAGLGSTGNIPVAVADSLWTSAAAPLNGRYIYSFRGGAASALDRYDIAANSWSAISYGLQQETLTTGASAVVYKDRILVALTPVAATAQRLAYFDVVKNEFGPLSTMLYPMVSALDGCRVTVIPFTDGDTVPFLYLWRGGGVELFRLMLF